MVFICTCCQVLGFVLGFIGFLGIISVCAIPMWKVTALVGSDITTIKIISEGLWMSCLLEHTGKMQCKHYDSSVALAQDLQVAQALIVISIIVCLFAIILGVPGGKCNNFVKNRRTKLIIAIASSMGFIMAGVLCLIPILWTRRSIIHDSIFTRSNLESGAAIYIGFGVTAVLLLSGLGILLCSLCPLENKKTYTIAYRYSQPQSTATTNI